MTTNEIERVVDAAAAVASRFLRTLETVLRAVSSPETQTAPPQPTQTEAVDPRLPVRCAICRDVHRVKTDGRNPLWVCQPCARHWSKWDGVSPVVRADLQVVGAGELR